MSLGATKRPLRVLLVEDSPDDAELVLLELARGGFEPIYLQVQTREDMTRALEEQPWQLILSDYSMPRFSAPEALAVLRSKDNEIPFIIVSGTVGEETAVQAMRLGVNDYILKGKLSRLCAAIERELRESDARQRARDELALSVSERERAVESLRRAEEQLLHTQKMEAVGRLAGSVAHDFNNLLSVILSYCALILKDLRPMDPLRPEISAIQRAGERAADLTRQLLAFSRKQVLAPRVLDLNQVLRESENILRRLIGEDVDFVTRYARNLPSVKIDPGQMDQVVMNLAVNARDAMPRGGKLTVETAETYLDESFAATHPEIVAGSYVMLAMSDTGIGMDKETQLRIFEPFFTTKGVGKGTGLGLSTVFGIIKQSGGSIWVYSEPNNGTTFKVYLPSVSEPASPASDPNPSPTTLEGTETILLVEDQDEVRAVALEVLRRFGYHVLEARNAGEALLHCERHPRTIQLLLTDVVMPQMNGRELAERLAPLRPNMRVLYMSGYTDNAIVQHGILDPGIEYLQKPLVPDILARRVREVLDSIGRSQRPSNA